MHCHGTLHVPLPPDEAIALFTPAGERLWVPGWDPTHAGDTVFTTEHDGTDTIWVIVDSTDRRRRYARVTPGVRAGTVDVRCEPEGEHTRVHVTYELTALGPDTDLDDFAAHYPQMLAHWERLIADACAATSSP
jgi:hypothetical protein